MSAREKVVRRKQYMVAGGIVGAILLVALGGGALLTDRKPPPPIVPPAVTTLDTRVKTSDKESWRATSAAEMQRMQQTLEELKLQTKRIQDDQVRQDEETRKRQTEEAARAKAPPAPVAPPPSAGEGAFRTVGNTPPPPSQGELGADEQLAPRSKVKTVDFSADAASSPVAQGANFLQQGAQDFGKQNQAAAAGVPAGQKAMTVDTYVPAGSYVRAIMLNGVDAPTGGQSQQNPAPAVLRLIDDGRLPNAFRGRLRDCVVTVNGYGELSSERALLRTDRLSCITSDGQAIDIGVKGYVAGEDGKTGMRGRVVSKTGQALANAIWAAGLSAIGSGVAGASTRSTQTALGTTTTTTDNPALNAFGQGVNKAFDRLAQYYINLADKLFPVIEVDGGRVVEVVFTAGFNMTSQQ